MGLSGILRFLAYRTIEILVVIMLIIHIPHIPPNAKISTPYNVPVPRPYEGALSLNNKLDDVEFWHKGDLIGPEAFAVYNDQLYTPIHGGDVVKLVGNHITPVVKFGKPCKGLHQEEICGRPLGMDFDPSGVLYVCDAYYGVYKVDVATGKKVQLISMNQEIDGTKPKLPNSITIAKNGDFYWTDSTTEFSLNDGIFDLLADGSGRLIHYNAKTKKNTVLMKDIHFANGVILSDNEEFVLVAETARSRILRYYLNGPKKGTHDIFIDGLPGTPDNIKSDGKGGFLVPLPVCIDKDHPLLPQVLGPFPSIRRLIVRSLNLIELAFKAIYRIWPNEFSEHVIHKIGHFSMVEAFLSLKRTTILHVSKTGEILDSLHTEKTKLFGISEVHIYKDTLYMGTPFHDYIARIPLKKVGWEHLAQQAKPATPKPTTTTPKPTTTTPKPTTTTTTTTPKPTTTTPKPTTTTPKPTTTTPKPTTTTPKPTTTTPKPTTTTPKPTTTTSKPTTTTPKPTTTTPKPTTTTPKPATTTPKPTTTTPKPTTTTPKPTTTTPKPATTTPKPVTTTQEPVTARATSPPPKPTSPPPPKPTTSQPPSKPETALPKTAPVTEPTKKTN